jgi:diguanylate cyclase (GGDEF)-like protein
MTVEKFQDILKPVITNKQEHVAFSTVHQRKDGTNYYVDVYLQGTIYQEKKAYVAIILDVTERVKTEKKLTAQRKLLHHKAHHHTLTGLPNRLLFTEILEESMKKALVQKTLLALFFIDLDKFKMINDQYGHGVGDDVLKIVALRLKGVIRQRDIAAHISGDEFVIIMQDFHTKDNASVLANKILKTLRKPIRVDSYAFSLSGSIGISFYSEDVKETHILLKQADLAMYQAKNSGRDTFRYFN